MRVFRWAKGLFVPKWDNKVQNSLLEMTHRHEINQEAAKYDFLANALFLSTAMGSEEGIRKKMKLLNDLSENFHSIIEGEYLDPAFRLKQEAKKESEKRKNLDLLEKVDKLAGMDSLFKQAGF